MNDQAVDPQFIDWTRAAAWGDSATLAKFLRSGWPVDIFGPDGLTALMLAAWGGHLDAMKVLLDHGADTELFVTPHHVECRALTFAAGLATPGTDQYPKTPDDRPANLLLASGARWHLLEAVLLNRPDIARLHLDRGEDSNSGKGCYHGPLLMQASICGYLDIIELLPAYGADIEATDDLSETSLVCAAAAGRFDVVDLLINRGAWIHATDVYGHTTLGYAAYAGRRKLVDELIERGCKRGILDALTLGELSMFRGMLAEVNDYSWRGIEAIDRITCGWGRLAMVAVGRGDPDFVGPILDRGAAHRLEAEDRSLLAQAARGGHLEVARLLIDRGADVHDVGKDGLTPLAWATLGGHHATCDFLKGAGAAR